MSKHMSEVMQRRQALLHKISAQRTALAEMGERWQPGLQVADQAVLAVRFLRGHPVLVAGVAGLLVVRRRGVTALMSGAWRVWKAYRYFNDLSRKVAERL